MTLEGGDRFDDTNTFIEAGKSQLWRAVSAEKKKLGGQRGFETSEEA